MLAHFTATKPKDQPQSLEGVQSNARLAAAGHHQVRANTPQSNSTITYLNSSCDNSNDDRFSVVVCFELGLLKVGPPGEVGVSLCGSEKLESHRLSVRSS